MTSVLTMPLPRLRRALLAGSVVMASASASRAISATDFRAVYASLTLICSAYALRTVYRDGQSILTNSALYEVLEQGFGTKRAVTCARLILLDHIGTVLLTAALVARHLPRALRDETNLPLSTAAPALLAMFFWRATLFPVGRSSARAAIIVRTTTITGLLAMIWCGTRCLARHRTPRQLGDASNWLGSFPGVLGILGSAITFRKRLTRKPNYDSFRTLAVVFVYALVLWAIVALLLTNATTMHTVRLMLEGSIVLIGFLILFAEVHRRRSDRVEFCADANLAMLNEISSAAIWHDCATKVPKMRTDRIMLALPAAGSPAPVFLAEGAFPVCAGNFP